MNDAKTLFIFEGGRAEDKYVKKLEQNFLGVDHVIKCVFDAEIYQLYRGIKQEDGFHLDIVSLLKERTAENAEILRNILVIVLRSYIYSLTTMLILHWLKMTKSEKCFLFSVMKPKKGNFISVIQWWKR